MWYECFVINCLWVQERTIVAIAYQNFATMTNDVIIEPKVAGYHGNYLLVCPHWEAYVNYLHQLAPVVMASHQLAVAGVTIPRLHNSFPVPYVQYITC